MAVATAQDVATSLGRPITDTNEIAQVEQWLADAELLIRLRYPDLTVLDQDALAYVEREAVVLRMRNPEGYQSETIDDYTYRWGSNAGRVTILDEWWQMLAPTSRGSFYTVGLVSPLDVEA